MKTLTVQAAVKIPKVPNFLLYDGGKLPLDAVSEDELRKVGEAWTERLLDRRREMAAGRKAP